MLKSLGLIETIGLTAGIEAADAAVKSANVKLIGYELSKGSGMTVIKVEGEVGAVKAAIDAATVAAMKVSKVVSTKVIPRPASGLEKLIHTKDTVGLKPEKQEPIAPIQPAINETVNTEPPSTMEAPIESPIEAAEKSEEAEEEEAKEDSEPDQPVDEFDENDTVEETETTEPETGEKETKTPSKKKRSNKPKK